MPDYINFFRNIHPDIVSVLCSLCPDLLHDLLDGMLWHSAFVENGLVRVLLLQQQPLFECLNRLQVRVNYYIRELYGDPESFHDAWESPFAVLALKGPTELFDHPVIEKVISSIMLFI